MAQRNGSQWLNAEVGYKGTIQCTGCHSKMLKPSRDKAGVGRGDQGYEEDFGRFGGHSDESARLWKAVGRVTSEKVWRKDLIAMEVRTYCVDFTGESFRFSTQL